MTALEDGPVSIAPNVDYIVNNLIRARKLTLITVEVPSAKAAISHMFCVPICP